MLKFFCDRCDTEIPGYNASNEIRFSLVVPQRGLPKGVSYDETHTVEVRWNGHYCDKCIVEIVTKGKRS